MVREILMPCWKNKEQQTAAAAAVVVNKTVRAPWTKEKVMEAFKSCDKDGDGRLNKEELKAAFGKLGSRWSSFRAWRALHHADANKDGFISMEEINDLVNYALKCGYKLKN